MAVSARRGQPLTLEEIYMTTLRLVDAGGVEGLSMRKLAAELDVNPMSLYHHVRNKEALVRETCAVVAARLRLPADDGTPWQDQLRALGHAYRSLARSHPSLWSYVNGHPDLSRQENALWAVFNRILTAAGIPAEDLVRTRRVLYSFVSGFLTAETSGLLVELEGTVDADSAFEVALDLIVAGLEARHSAVAGPPPELPSR
ncbi:TetR/AcrR family transcriptional regulator [Streptosporangium sp. NBC_01756]|uniref:TetR/AcrR family transcriptional regulator n=1 Tax=Streptosporangium sp. NBC_01756 TaxID=2975950 RepID=UPI002DDB513F|nr:TetR/AcrR family transcriptional regulator [Streptosporangium sp. NBC_01756]WSC89619.1 TetR/AcrR family transcriptional regulator [Streptosporangium sp. NBC_01756]